MNQNQVGVKIRIVTVLSGGCTRPKCDEPKSSFKICEAKLAKPKGEIDPEL